MQEQKIQDEVSSIILNIECKRKMREVMLSAWATFEAFLHHNDWLPDRLEDISETAFPPFVKHCKPPRMDEETLLTMLAALRFILARGGYRTERLTGLTAPTVRKRIANDPNGKYRRRNAFKDTAA